MPDDEDPIIGDGEEDWFGEADPRVPAGRGWADSSAHDLDFLGDLPRPPEDDYTPAALDPAALRELERRVEHNRTPAFPIDLRKRLPLEAVWRRWRALAMWGRSDVVDDF